MLVVSSIKLFLLILPFDYYNDSCLTFDSNYNTKHTDYWVKGDYLPEYKWNLYSKYSTISLVMKDLSTLEGLLPIRLIITNLVI